MTDPRGAATSPTCADDAFRAVLRGLLTAAAPAPRSVNVYVTSIIRVLDDRGRFKVVRPLRKEVVRPL